jgi:hypothetical protein
MSDESNWQNHVDSKERGSVSANVNARAVGEQADDGYITEEAADDTAHHTCHPGCEHWEEEQDTRSNREKLLAGETVEGKA